MPRYYDTYANVYAFTPPELFLTFNPKTIKTHKKEMLKGSCHDKMQAAVIVFDTAMRIVIDDVIENGTEFRVRSGIQDACIYLKTYIGDEFIKQRKMGFFRYLDPMETNFTGAALRFELRKRGKMWLWAYINIDKPRQDRIIELTKQNKLRVGRVKTFVDYYDAVQEEFPTLRRDDIYRILRFGFNSFRLHMAYGGDVRVQAMDPYFVMQTCGPRENSKERRREYFKKKLKIKIRVLYRKMHILWNGWSWFTIGLDAYDKIKNDIAAGKTVDFGNILLHKCYEDTLAEIWGKAVMLKVPAGDPDTKFCNYEHLVTDKAVVVHVFNVWTIGVFERMRKNREFQVLFTATVNMYKMYKQNIKPYAAWLRQRRLENQQKLANAKLSTTDHQ